ncbi:MAG: helix-turn-helix domain-containing protein, partial [Candidatus Gastranaerophilales bacterium]|nr:helix-turn-helix domain-containing protein [Candidatus Gastranaerophilales bacterium]
LIRLGLKLKILRSIKKLSQDDVANQLNIDKSYYSKVERGLTNPTLLYMKHLSEILDIELSDLMDSSINI